MLKRIRIMEKTVINLYNECLGAKSIIITGHIKPDGDCIGSCLAACLYLKKRLPESDIKVVLDKPAECFDYVPGLDLIDSTFSGEKCDILIVIDTNIERIGSASKFASNTGKIINIDHHISNVLGGGDVNYIVPEASSASELVYNLIEEEYLDDDIAALLYMGIAHDTGVFRYTNTNSDTMLIASKLMRYNFDHNKILEETFYEKSYLQYKALSYVLMHSRLFLGGNVIASAIDLSTMKELGVTNNDFDGVVSTLRATKGVECSIFMYQINSETYKISLRSSRIVDVSRVASEFGGGGHVRAAGLYLKGNKDEIIDKLINSINKDIKWTE